MSRNLVFLAGPKATHWIRERGLAPDDVKLVLGAAGGPKWLMLAELDRYLFGNWLARRQTALHLLGASIGAWRHAVYCSPDPIAALDQFLAAYLDQRYSSRPTTEEIQAITEKVLAQCLPPERRAALLAHPTFRLNILTARTRGPLKSDRRLPLTAGLAAAGLANLVARRGLALFMERVLFHHPDGMGPCYGEEHPLVVPLTPENLGPALFASGSIPLVMGGVRDIAGAPRGMYRDGGLIDYHFDISLDPKEGIALFPHFSERLVPGWFDKHLSWRKHRPAHLDPVLVIAPSAEFIARLPHGRITDRGDFDLYAGRNDSRITYWNAVLGETERLRDELQMVLERGLLAERLQPLLPR